MEIIPAVDIRGGRCVRLYQGDFERETVFAQDPLAVALHWQGLGAPRLHVVDLDGARLGRPVHGEIIDAILRQADIPVQVGGGIRRMSVITHYIEAGADRVVLGTAAVKEPRLLEEACRLFGEGIVVSVDARGGWVATDGWQGRAHLRARHLMARLEALGVRRFIYTDIVRDGTLSSPNFRAIGRLLPALDAALLASGGVASLAHLRRLARSGVEGAIVGRALYTGAIDLGRALAWAEGESPGTSGRKVALGG